MPWNKINHELNHIHIWLFLKIPTQFKIMIATPSILPEHAKNCTKFLPRKRKVLEFTTCNITNSFRFLYCRAFEKELNISAGSVIYPPDRKCMTDTIFLGPKLNRTKIRKWPKITETRFYDRNYKCWKKCTFLHEFCLFQSQGLEISK